jgi:Chlorophyll A-B binding protein
VGWPLSELLNKKIAEYWDLPAVIVSDDRVPAVLNNNLGLVSPIFWGICLGTSAAIDIFAILKSRDASDLTYFPGNLGFDPLRLYPADNDGQQWIRRAEIKNGRLAMISVSAFALQEYVSKVGVVDQTPFFHPFSSGI